MKKRLQLWAFIFTFLAILLVTFSNVQLGRIIYKNIFTRQLGRGIHKLFQNPSKYRSRWVDESPLPGTKLFCLQKGQNGFRELKSVILDNYYKTYEGKELGYVVKAIMQYQYKSESKDTQNPIFVERRIYFVRETIENKDVDFEKNPTLVLKGTELITKQKVLTENLDTFFTFKIALWASVFLVIALVLDVKIWRM